MLCSAWKIELGGRIACAKEAAEPPFGRAQGKPHSKKNRSGVAGAVR